MLGGRILGEGVDGCVFTDPMWPCTSESKINEIPDSKDSKYVSKLVSVKDKESNYLRMAARILGPEITSRYISALKGECKPADLSHLPHPENKNALLRVQENIIGSKKSSNGVCKSLMSDPSVSDKYKIMYISRYSMSVDQWVRQLQKQQQTYLKTIQQVEGAIPIFLDVLQRLFQGDKEQLIHIDLHTGNLFIRPDPLEFGIADFGHCISRRYDIDQSIEFYGEYLNRFIASHVIYTGEYNQTPFESRLLNFCYKKSMDLVSPATLVRQWEADPEVRSFTNSTDIISAHKTVLLNELLKKPLFIAMIETIQSISKKLRVHPSDSVKLVQSLQTNEKIVLDYIMTRYSIFSPLVTITSDIMALYPTVPLFDSNGLGSSKLIRFIKKAILAPYNQTMPLVSSVKAIQDADLRILWQMTS
jgi:hypothetical protein